MKYDVWLNRVRGISNKKKIKMCDTFGSAKALFFTDETSLIKYNVITKDERDLLYDKRGRNTVEEEYKRLLHKKVEFYPYYHEKYPRRLSNIHDKPFGIYVKGATPGEVSPCAAIVGARNCSSYGEIMAAQIAEELSDYGVHVISGLARGIDAAGHRGCLNGGGKTFAVLGSGVNVCYPRENKGLYEDVIKTGGIISEFNLDEPPLKTHFPARNRIISSLCDVLIVIEAKARSGSLITADFALEHGKDIYALPGPVTSDLSYGCNNLIRQGAGIITSAKELIDELKINTKKSIKKQVEKKIMLETVENIVYSCLDFYPKNFEQISLEVNMGVSELMNELISLELKGYIEEISKNYYVKCKL
ncbi:MAG: DNA-processing protein DprA [Suipraeoptans sp.]